MTSKFFATTSDDISKAAVDFFSLGHIITGQILFFIFYGLFKWPLAGTFADVEIAALIFTVICGIIWEVIENTIVLKMGLKFENKRDSWLNLIFDIIFVIIGGLISMFINNWIVNLVLVLIELYIFITIWVIVKMKSSEE